MTLPMVLKQLREELQLQQKELAELLSVNSTTVNRWEVGKTRPTKAVCNLLLRVAKENGASEVCLASLQDALFPRPDLEEKTNDIRYTEIDSINRLLNESPNGVIVIDYETYDILYMNDKMTELTGVSMEEVATVKCYQLLAQEEQPCDICHKGTMSYEDTSESVYSSARYRNCHGSFFAIRTKLTTWKGKKALIKYFTDITELHELQQQVQQQQKALNHVAEFSGMQVFEYDIQKNTAVLMTETLDSNGLPRIVGDFDKTVLDSKIILPEYQRAYSQMLQDMKEGKKQAEVEVRTNEPDGTSNWLYFQMNLTAFDENGKPIRAICSVRNINQEKFAYARLAQGQKLVQDMFTNQITSEKNVGTTVRMSFRLECLEKNHKEEKTISKVAEYSDAILIGKHVLLAEDHPLNAQIAIRLLKKKQMIVRHADNGKVAVEIFAASKERQFDVILMDIRMPEMSGLDAAKAIRALERPDAKTVPILAMSANAYSEDVQNSLDAGMNGHLAKPVNPELLYRELINYISESECDGEQDSNGGDIQ